MYRLPASLAAFTIVLGTSTMAADAEDGAARQPSGLDFSLGAGIGVAPDYEGSDSYEPMPLWQLRIGNLYHPETYLHLYGPNLESNLLPDDHFRLGLTAHYLSDYDDVDDNAVERLSEPEAALQTGLVFGYDFSSRSREDYVLEVEATYDALHGNGGLVTPRARVALPVTQRLSLGGALSATWASEDFMSNRFGVSSRDAARSGLDAFEAGAGFKDVSLDLSLSYAVSESWSVVTFGGYKALLGDAADSPIVDDRGDAHNFVAGALVSYRF